MREEAGKRVRRWGGGHEQGGLAFSGHQSDHQWPTSIVWWRQGPVLHRRLHRRCNSMHSGGTSQDLPLTRRCRTRSYSALHCCLRNDSAPPIVVCEAAAHPPVSFAKRQSTLHCCLRRDSAPSVVACEATVRPPLPIEQKQCTLHCRLRSDRAPSIVAGEGTVRPPIVLCEESLAPDTIAC